MDYENSKKNERNNIVNATYDIFINKKLINEVFEVYDMHNDLDNSLLKKEILGVLENKLLLEYIISKYLKIKISKLDYIIYIVLLLGCYELLFLDKIPSYASINSYVEIIKKSKVRKFSSFVNAILRNIDRNEKLDDIKQNKKIEENILYSIPKDLYDKFLKNKVSVKYAIKKHFYIRINSFDNEIINFVIDELNKNNVKYRKYAGNLDIKYFCVLEVLDIKSILSMFSYNKGYIYIEDISSIYMIEKIYDYCIKSLNNYNILDSCSAPGGKITGLYYFLKKNYKCMACDISKEKIGLIKQNIARLNIKDISVLKKDATILDTNLVNKFNIVILDAPCSGLGVISKKPDIKYNFSNEKTKCLIKIQKDMLDIQKEYIISNGYLIYSTCTINEDENEIQISNFLNKNKNFELIYKQQILQDISNKSDGFYFAIMKRIK